MPVVPIVLGVAAGIVMGMFNSFVADNKPKRSKISDADRTRKKILVLQTEKRIQMEIKKSKKISKKLPNLIKIARYK